MKSTKPAGSSIKPCGCSHPVQDAKYGLGNRVHNASMKGWRCTVCLSVKNYDNKPKADVDAAPDEKRKK